jgi:membrane protease subunit (stomatin/prohibitin family)
VYFFSTRQQIDQKWGTPQAITIRDAEFGAVRLRAFGNYSYRLIDPLVFHTEIAGTQTSITSADMDGQLRALVVQNISVAIAQSSVPFLDLASNLLNFAQVLTAQLAAQFGKLGLKLEGMTVQSVSLPEELQKIMDQKIGMGMVGDDLTKFMRYQAAQSLTDFSQGGEGAGMAGGALVLGAGAAMGQVMAQNVMASLQATPTTAIKPEDVMATLEKLGDLASKGILTTTEFEAKKTELLKKLV